MVGSSLGMTTDLFLAQQFNPLGENSFLGFDSPSN
jgi:hypothetical protein